MLFDVDPLDALDEEEVDESLDEEEDDELDDESEPDDDELLSVDFERLRDRDESLLSVL